ncbi:MAG: hypothetical protein SVG88_12865 [Halobacteriales archaeon]|nr:hypothetical protein [Halobacteriales archaeon]
MSDVQLADDNDSETAALTASIKLRFSTSGSDGPSLSFAKHETHIDTDGRLTLGFESVGSVLPTADDIDIEPINVDFDSDCGIVVTLGASVPTGDPGETVEVEAIGSNRTESTSATTAEDAIDSDASTDSQDERDIPPFRDTELLAEVYESCDRFADMADALDMDVTGETVRRYMIDHGIHDPDSYNTTDTERGDTVTDDDLAATTVLADGIGLPDGVTPDTLVEAVKDATTIYEIQREIGIDRDQTLTMLQELGLLDFVVGRLDTTAEREITREDVINRLRARSAEQ